MKSEKVIADLKSLANPENVAGMARYGISTEGTLGVPMPILRRTAKDNGQDHDLALLLWDSGIHEARILAALIDIPKPVTEEQMEKWVLDFDSWDVCDQVCSNLFDKTALAFQKAVEWSAREETFVKRAGFVLMAALAVHDEKAGDEVFAAFLPIIAREAGDERNFVKKAVNWALRQIGKRNPNLLRAAVETAEAISDTDSRSARWVASDVLREFRKRSTIAS